MVLDCFDHFVDVNEMIVESSFYVLSNCATIERLLRRTLVLDNNMQRGQSCFHNE